jgi:AbrB family looped-hinge helix DNA binding protein
MASKIAKVTVKGQVTIPKDIRRALDIQERDSLLFRIEEGRLIVTPLPRRPVGELCGALPATREYPGHDKIREELQAELGVRRARGEE